MTVSVCLSVRSSLRPLAYLKNPHVRTIRNSLYMLPVAVARSSSDNSAIRYVLPVLWMTFARNGVNRDTVAVGELLTVTRQTAPRTKSVIVSVVLLIRLSTALLAV